MRICSPFDQVVEESDVTVCSYVVEDLEAVVMALAWSKTTISALVVRLGNIDAVIEQPVDGFSRVGIIPDASQLYCLLSQKKKRNKAYCRIQCPLILMSYPNSTSSFTRSIDRFMHRGMAQTAGSAPYSRSMRMSDNFPTVLSRHSVASALVIQPLSRSSRRRWLSLALQAAANARTLSSFAPLYDAGLLTALDLGIAVMVWEVAECTTASSVTAERARSKGSVECSTALQNLQ